MPRTVHVHFIRTLVALMLAWIFTSATAEVKPNIETVRDEITKNILTSEAEDRIYDKMAAIFKLSNVL